ncbi:MAG: non-heme iron oxygenase ferredoxin subunit [SAR202 cluster bacterium]|nr:non-heme iron oxygenase ferredoxin subunit [SAR202 cluster bacterium]
MNLIKICDLSEIPNGSIKKFEINDEEITICNINNQIFAINDNCSHDEASLQEGFIDGYEIECPMHGAKFDIRTGEVTCLPAVSPIKTYNIKINNGAIELEI